MWALVLVPARVLKGAVVGVSVGGGVADVVGAGVVDGVDVGPGVVDIVLDVPPMVAPPAPCVCVCVCV